MEELLNKLSNGIGYQKRIRIYDNDEFFEKLRTYKRFKCKIPYILWFECDLKLNFSLDVFSVKFWFDKEQNLIYSFHDCNDSVIGDFIKTTHKINHSVVGYKNIYSCFNCTFCVEILLSKYNFIPSRFAFSNSDYVVPELFFPHKSCDYHNLISI
jgi:hypothetical protein